MTAAGIARIDRGGETPAARTQKSKADVELDQALEEFEALFASTLLRTAREESGSGWLGGEASAGSDGILDFAEQHIARAMARQGAFGIAKTLGVALRKQG